MYRQQNNGTPTVQTGTILGHLSFECFDNAIAAAKNLDILQECIGCHEVHGVAGDYKIVRRAKEATPSDYIKRK